MSRIAALILAAGRSTRFVNEATATKAVAEFSGTPLIRHVAEAALASHAHPVIVVTGHSAPSISAALKPLDVQIVYAEDYAKGQSRSLRAGVAAIPSEFEGVVVLLADMPLVSSALIDDLIGAFEKTPGAAAVVPSFAGRRGNPVLLGRQLFPTVARLDGDRGAGPLLAHLEGIIEYAVTTSSIHVDVDTEEDLQRLNAEHGRNRAL